jgi:organic radical activating enzyme
MLGDERLIIYGAGASGQLLKRTLDLLNVNIHAFVDKAADRLIKIQNIPVYNPGYLSEAENGTVVIVATNLKTQYKVISDTVHGYNDNLCVLDGFVINRILRYSSCFEKLEHGEPCDLIECENCGFERHECLLALSYLRKVAHATIYEDREDWRSGKFDWFGYIVGQVCTLKCVHCCEAIPFLKEHAFVDCDTIISDVKKVAESCRFLKFVELIGGEPFLHPEIKKTLISLLEIKNIGYIKVFTNATVVPDDSLCIILKDPRIMLQVSNYEGQASGRILENIISTRKKLAEERVPYIFTPNLEWRDFSSFDLHNSEVDKLKKVFADCPLLNCHRLYKGVLYRCPHQYAGLQLGTLLKYDVECIDINRYSRIDLAKALEVFENVDYIDACRYCTMPFDAPVVPAGEQLR